MECFVERVVTDRELTADCKELIPDAALRRRMSRIVRLGVAAGVACAGGPDAVAELDAIVTATGWGCLSDSERFLRNLIDNGEELLNPTPFIQSTFNTVGAQIALLGHNRCYNTTYVDRSRSFETALLDAAFGIEDGESHRVLVGAYDERTPTSHRILERMGLWRRAEEGEGCVFALLTDRPTPQSLARIVRIDFPQERLSREECAARYASRPDAVVLWNDLSECGLYPTASARGFARAAALVAGGAAEAVVYNVYWGATPAVVVLQWVG